MRMSVIAALGAAMMLGGCATVVRGTNEVVMFDSDPPGAVMRSVIDYPCGGPCAAQQDALGSNTYVTENEPTPEVPGPACTTPCSIQVARNQSLRVTFAKPGYETAHAKLETKVVGGGVAATAGNVILGGAVGLVTDAVTSAGMDHHPNPLKVTLRPIAAAEPPARRKSGR